ncbi:unnamed protein product [Nesidiocoris tenuis]|uniref:Cytochrome P450 n=1 Tax=Nesidiocoris tenuis TaxID=355587 RepID=A0A6H5G5B1_9HEMI|nr:unnamed protein product [Nesidiocoris tenuis]
MYEEGRTNFLLLTVVLLSLPWILVKFVNWAKSRKRLLNLAARIPGPQATLFLGNALSLMAAPSVIFQNVLKASANFPDIMKMWIGPRLIVFLVHPNDIELVLGSNERIDKAPEYRFFKPWLGDGLLISTGAKWRAHRKLIAPTFHLNVLKTFIGVFNRNSKSLVRKLESEIGKEFDCHDYMSEATVEILLETAMGVDKKTNKNCYDYAMAVMKMCDILHLRQTKIWMRPDLLFNLSSYGRLQKKLLETIHDLTRTVVTLRKADFAEGKFKTETSPTDKQESQSESTTDGYSFGKSAGLYDDIDDDTGEKKRLAFLDLMISCSEQGSVLTNEEIQNQVDTIMFEGHDTTAAASSFFLCVLADRSDIQDAVLNEIDRVLGCSDREITFQDTLELKYMERCIMETLRMFPPVPIIARELSTELKLDFNTNYVLRVSKADNSTRPNFIGEAEERSGPLLSTFFVIAAALACANAGLAPVAYSAAPALSYGTASYGIAPAAPLGYGHAALAPAAITSQSQNILRSYGNLGQVSTYSKTIDTPYSSVRKSDVRVSNPGLATVAHAPLAYAAAPAIAHAPLAYSAAPAYAARAVAAPVAHAGLLGVAYSAAPAVSHITFDGFGAHYGWILSHFPCRMLRK